MVCNRITIAAIFGVLVAISLPFETSCHLHDVITTLVTSKSGNWLFARSRFTLMRSNTGGDSWEALRNPAALVIDDLTPNYHAYPAVQLSPNFDNDQTLLVGNYISTDAGSTWAQWSSNLGASVASCDTIENRPNGVVFSSNFAADNTIYAVGRKNGKKRWFQLLYSTDLGETFLHMSGLGFFSPSSAWCPLLTATAHHTYVSTRHTLYTAVSTSSTKVRCQLRGRERRRRRREKKRGSPMPPRGPGTRWKCAMPTSSTKVPVLHMIFQDSHIRIDQLSADSSAEEEQLLLIDDKAQQVYRMEAHGGRLLNRTALTTVPLPTKVIAVHGRDNYIFKQKDLRLVTTYMHQGVGDNTSMIVLRSICPTKALCRVNKATWKKGEQHHYSVNHSVLLSRDGGATWTHLFIDDFFAAQGGGLSASWEEREFSLVVGVPGTPRIFLGTFTGVYRSDDHGESWVELDTITRHIKGLSAVKAPAGHVRISTCTYGGFCWSGVADLTPLRNGSTSQFPDGFMTQLPLEDAWPEYNNVAFSPSPIGIGFIFLSSKRREINNFFLRTTDNFAGGLNIHPNTHSNTGPIDLPRFKLWIKSVVHAIEFSPRFKIDGIMFVGGINIGICKSTDYGLTFQTVLEFSKQSNLMVTQIVIPPTFVTSGILFAIVKNQKGALKRIANIYLSEDGGNTWKMLPDSEQEWLSISLAVGKASLVGVVADGSALVMQHPDYKMSPLSMPRKYKGTEFSRDSHIVHKNGKFIFGLAKGGVLQGKLVGTHLTSIKIRGNAQRWTFGETNYFSEGARKLYSHVVAKSPYYAKDGTIFGASHYEIYASQNHGKTWNLVYTLPFMAPRFSGSNQTITDSNEATTRDFFDWSHD